MTPVIWLHPEAPAKPALGAACNGCGVCCALEPCPAGMLVSRRRKGRCKALVWADISDSAGHYRCGLITQPAQVLGWRDTGISAWLARRISRAARRWISAGSGCDAALEIHSAVDQAGSAASR